MSFDEEGDHYMSKAEFAMMCDEIKNLTSKNAEFMRKLQDAELRNCDLVVHGQDKSRLIENLMRKLAEQQAVMKNYDFDESDYAELTKLLAEAKSKAVPEGWQVARCSEFEIRVKSPNGDAWRFSHSDDGTSNSFLFAFLDAMLSAVPQPETAKCKSCGGNDEDVPCAYPGEHKHGCLRDARMTQSETDIDQARRFK